MSKSSHLPDISTYFAQCTARMQEIRDIDVQLNKCEHGLRAFQRLPRNMQRRAVSHNPQRLPRSLREKHRREVGNKIKVSKRPSRKYRRKPSNLLAEYNRRQRQAVWLETHIWHAKRFHMTSQWGYSLPKSPTTKAFRPSLRAATETCLIQDVSYECCFEIEAQHYSQIRDPLSSLLSLDDLLCLKTSEKKKGFEWVRLTLYHQGRFPYCAIGDCQMIWVSSSSNESAVKLWMWVHPSAFEEVMENLIKIFDYKKLDNNNDSSSTLKPADCVLAAKLSTKQWTVDKTPKYVSSCTSLTVLKDALVKFRLIGPTAYALIRKVLQPSTVFLNNNETMRKSPPQSSNEAEDAVPWWVRFFSNTTNSETYKAQLSVLESVVQPNVGTSRRAFSLVARDPRVLLPVKKEASDYETEMENSPRCEAISTDGLFAVHPICDSGIRESVTSTMQSTHAINEMRSRLMVPGTRLPLTEKESRVPVMLLERPSSHISKLGSGWDVIMPCGWAAQTLVAFAMNGGAVGGQSQEETLKGEFLMPPNPHHLPDTAAGKRHALAQRQAGEKEYFKRPPNCRVNFIKLGVRSPFDSDWFELLKSWNSSCERFYVLRNRKILSWLALKSCKKLGTLSLKRKLCEMEENTETEKEQSPFDDLGMDKTPLKLAEELKDTLIYVRLVLLEKGSLEPFAMICLPMEEDLKSFEVNGSCSVVESAHEDVNAAKRKEKRTEHIKHLNSLRRKRKKARGRVLCGEENPLEKHATMEDALKVAVQHIEEENKDLVTAINAYKSAVNELWLRDPDQESFQCCARKVIGFLTEGGFYMRIGRSGGLGYVVSEVLLRYMDRLQFFKSDGRESDSCQPKQVVVLVRKPSTLEYKWARLVVLNVWH